MSEIAKAKAEAVAARTDLLATVDLIRARLAPRHLAEDAWEGVRDRGTQLAEDVLDRGTRIAGDAVEIARARPRATAALAATAALLLARNPLKRAASSLFPRRIADDTIAPPPLDGV